MNPPKGYQELTVLVPISYTAMMIETFNGVPDPESIHVCQITDADSIQGATRYIQKHQAAYGFERRPKWNYSTDGRSATWHDAGAMVVITKD